MTAPEYYIPDFDRNRPKLLLIVGPTASGKSELAVRLAEMFDGEVVNADSMQIYSEMPIGTAAPSADMLPRVPHHLFSICSPEINFTAADYRSRAREVINDISRRGKLPILCGGTGLYIRVLLTGIAESPAGSISIRQELLDFVADKGVQALHDRLQEVDAQTADRLHPNDTLRVIRALEVYEQTGRAFSDFHAGHQFSESWCKAVKIGIHPERGELYDRINLRVDKMMADGLLPEVERLLVSGYSAELKSMRAIGYRELCEHLAGKLTLQDAVELIKRNSRRYAKRQLTWFRSDPEIIWFETTSSIEKIAPLVSGFLLG